MGSPSVTGGDGAKRRGQSLVELALALPLMLLIMLGTIDFGRAYFDYIQMRNAAMEGAIYGARNPGDTDGARTRVLSHGVPDDIEFKTLGCSGPGCNEVGKDGEFVIVVWRDFTPVTTGFFRSFRLEASATARVMS